MRHETAGTGQKEFIIGRYGLMIPAFEFDENKSPDTNLFGFFRDFWELNGMKARPGEGEYEQDFEYYHEIVVPASNDRSAMIVRSKREKRFTPAGWTSEQGETMSVGHEYCDEKHELLLIPSHGVSSLLKVISLGDMAVAQGATIGRIDSLNRNTVEVLAEQFSSYLGVD